MACAFVLSCPCPSLPTASPRNAPSHHIHPTCSQKSPATLPSTYTELTTRAIASVQAALAIDSTSASTKLLEVQFPAVANLATAALNELLDANRTFALSFVRGLDSIPSRDISILFPDKSEADLARKAWGNTAKGLDVTSIPPLSRDGFMVNKNDDEMKRRVCIVVNPGFNVNEWLACEQLDGVRAIVMINGELDRVRSGYYPRLFYPKLWKCNERFLKRFQEVFYVKMLSNGGTLVREFPECWKLLYWDLEGELRVLKEFQEGKPKFWDLEKLLRVTRGDDLTANPLRRS